ncbi:MAG: hypothetical protein F6J90_18520 [Moorea sp. SIOASIH]|uniref:hypothetical protein n=1 Tax=Moorena sp. SIOASIH TaxID=2607817 RepID=UPI0013B67C24|nr:hypothetical protein [Moorena sp. SIOASIH]NEO38216.1 hypothetical protein [Moorena sp. SIOASIH]
MATRSRSTLNLQPFNLQPDNLQTFKPSNLQPDNLQTFKPSRPGIKSKLQVKFEPFLRKILF